MDLFPKVQEAAVKGDMKQIVELYAQASEGDLSEEQQLILGSYAETARMYEVIDGRARPDKQGEQKFAEGDEEEPAKEEEKTDARRDAYMATRFAWI